MLQLDDVQSRLLDIGAVVATPASTSSAFKLKRVAFEGERYVGSLEVRPWQGHMGGGQGCACVLARSI